MEMPDSLADPLERCLRFEELGEVWELRWTFDEIRERSWAKLESDVKPRILLLLVEVADDVGMKVGGLEKGDFMRGEGSEVREKAFHRHGTRLKGSCENEGGQLAD